VGAEAVVLHHVAPVAVDDPRPLRAGADPVPPVVLVGEAAAWPAQVRDVQRPQCLDDVGPDAVDVRDLGVGADEEAAVDAAAKWPYTCRLIRSPGTSTSTTPLTACTDRSTGSLAASAVLLARSNTALLVESWCELPKGSGSGLSIQWVAQVTPSRTFSMS
jgi:hypothetical protein